MNKKIFSILFLYVICFSSYAQKKVDMPFPVFGEYTAYKFFALPVNEMTDTEAKMLLGGKMIIEKDYSVIFGDTLKKVEYSISQSEPIDHYRVYRHFDYRKLGIVDDTVSVVSMVPLDTSKTPIDIVVSKEGFLAVEYKSYIFLFSRRR